MTYGKKPDNKFSKKFGYGGKREYTPTIKDSFNSFIVSLIGLPHRVINNPIHFSKEKIDELFEKAGDNPITLRTFITQLFGVSSEDQIDFAMDYYFKPDSEENAKNKVKDDVKSLTYKLSSFEKSLNSTNQKEPYKSLGLDLVKGLREAYGIK